MPSYYCIDCGRQREFLNVKRAAEMAQVTRATIYNWLKKTSLHLIVHPSGRKYICTASILTVGVPDDPDALTPRTRATGDDRRRELGHGLPGGLF